MAYDPIRWGYQDSSGRQREADGSRLINLFPIETPDPAADKVPADLWNTPGAKTWKASPLTGNIQLERRLSLGFDLAPQNDVPRGQWGNGATLWVANAGATKALFAYDIASRAYTAARDIPLGGDALPTGVTGRGTTIWVAFENFAGLHAYDTVTRALNPALNIQTTQTDIVGLWIDAAGVMWALGKNGQARPYNIPPSTDDLPAPFSLLSGGINRVPSGATRLADGEVAIIDEATRDIFGTQSRAGGRNEAGDFDFRKAYPDIGSGFGFVNDSTVAWRVAASQIYAMHVGQRAAFEDRNITLPDGTVASYLYGEGDSLWVLLKPTDGSAPYIAQYNGQTGRISPTFLYPGPDVSDPQGLFSRGEYAWIADRAVNKLLRFRFGTTGVPDPDKNITVPPERDSPRGIWAEADTAFILDMLDAEVYGYDREDGTPDEKADFPVSGTPNAIGVSATSQYFFLLTATTIDTYQRAGGNKLPLLTITLDPLNADPRGIFTTESHAYVLDATARKIMAYLWTAGGRFGQRNSALDKTPAQLYAGLDEPVGLTGIQTGGRTRVWVLGEDGSGIRELEQAQDGVLTARGAGAANIPAGNIRDDEDANDLAVYDNGGTLRLLWANDADNAIYASDMTAGGAWGAPRQLIQQASNPHAVAVDDTYIYTTDDGRSLVRYAQSDLAKDPNWSISLSDHNISRRIRGLFVYQGRIWFVAHNTTTVYCFDIATKQPLNDFRIFSSVTRPRSLWGDGRYMYLVDERESTTRGGIQGYWMGSSVRDPDRDIPLHADNDEPYGLFGSATTLYVGNRGMRRESFAYSIARHEYIEGGGFPLYAENSRPIAGWGTASGAYILDENRTAYWYGSRIVGLVRDAPGDIPLHRNNGSVAGIWGDTEGNIFAANSSPGGIFAYDTDTKENLPALEFPLPQELIDNLPSGVWGDAQNLWIGAELNAKVYGFLRKPGADRDVLCPLTQRNASPYGIWSSADFHYVNDVETRRMFVYDEDTCRLALSDDTEQFMSNATWLAMIAIHSPVNGDHLFGVAQDVYFHFNPGAPFNDSGISHTGKFTDYEEEQINTPVKLATDNRYIFIITPVSVKIYDILTRKLVEEAEAGEEEEDGATLPRATNVSAILRDEDWVSAAWSDGYFLIGTRSGEVFHSNHQSLRFDQLDFSRTEAYPDSLISIEVYNRQLILFGSESIEQWYNSGDATAVFKRNLSLTVNIGAAAQAAISVDIEGIFFLATNGIVYQFIGRMVRVSSLSVEESAKQSDLSKATSYVYTEDGQRFYVLTLDIGGEKKTWAMHIETRLWHERTINDVRAIATFQGKIIASRTGGLDEMSVDFGADHDRIIRRQAVLPALQAGHMRQTVHAIEVDIPYRDGGAATDKVALDWSYNGGKTFFPPQAIEQLLPAQAPDDDEEVPRLRWNRLGGGDRVRHFRLTIDALRRVNILGAYMEHEGGAT